MSCDGFEGDEYHIACFSPNCNIAGFRLLDAAMKAPPPTLSEVSTLMTATYSAIVCTANHTGPRRGRRWHSAALVATPTR